MKDDNHFSAENLYVIDGHIDFYWYHSLAGGWFAGGWLAHPWPLGHRPGHAVAEFQEGATSTHAMSTFQHRDDLGAQGIGFVFFLQSTSANFRNLNALRVTSGRTAHSLATTLDTARLPEAELVGQLTDLLAGGDEGSRRREMYAVLFGQAEAENTSGLIDTYAYHIVSGGWLMLGWTARG
jgi:hypothetical protein